MALAVDGLGHGPEAARAAGLAIDTAEAHAARPLIEIVEECHRRLLPTRGAALSLARWSAPLRRLEWIGVGNVEGLVLQPAAGAGIGRERLLLRSGLVGVNLPLLRVQAVEVPGDGRLIFATDGIGREFDRGLDPSDPPQTLADRILVRSFKGDDDALVLVVRLHA